MELAGKYTIESLISFGSFEIIYKAWDKNMEKFVVIKECFPVIYAKRAPGEKSVSVSDICRMADFENEKRNFLEDAGYLYRFKDHPNIVHLYDFFEENGTAYSVMELLKGCNLKTFIQANARKCKKINLDTALQITFCLLDALREIHTYKIIHGDIKPASIFMCEDGTIRLINFNTMHFMNDKKRKVRTIYINPGYTPIEQYYVKSKCGPYTDIYSIAAVLYEMLTGLKPVESITRKVADTLVEPRKINQNIPANINNAVMRAMSVHAVMRFRNVNQFAKALKSKKDNLHNLENQVLRE